MANRIDRPGSSHGKVKEDRPDRGIPNRPREQDRARSGAVTEMGIWRKELGESEPARMKVR